MPNSGAKRLNSGMQRLNTRKRQTTLKPPLHIPQGILFVWTFSAVGLRWLSLLGVEQRQWPICFVSAHRAQHPGRTKTSPPTGLRAVKLWWQNSNAKRYTCPAPTMKIYKRRKYLYSLHSLSTLAWSGQLHALAALSPRNNPAPIWMG
jgi:hypothetical protein